MHKLNHQLKVFRQTGTASAEAEAGEHLNQFLSEHKKKPVLLLLSAGSALAILDYVGKTALSENLTISMLDERFSQDLSVNNFSQMQKTQFYQDALDAECSFFGTLPRPGESIENLVERWEKKLKTWQQENPNGLIIATLGMGADGHTAGMFPFPESNDEFKNLFEAENWVVGYNVGEKNQYKERLTTTITFFKNIDIGVAFVCGLEKKPKLDEVISGAGSTNQLPALAWHEIKNVEIFTDID